MVVVQDATALVWLSRHPDVQVLRWPEDLSERAIDGVRPCLWLVDEGETPPEPTSCVEDWLWVTASDLEMQARLGALATRAANHPPCPSLDPFGQLSYGTDTLFLSPTDESIMRVLVDHFGEVVEDDELIARAWPEGATAQVLRVHVSRLRRRLQPLGLTITCARGAGYLLAHDCTH